MQKRQIKTDIIDSVENMDNNTTALTDNTLRPQCLKDYIGQKKLVSSLKIYIDAAKKRNDALDHLLFYGPPGLGKTTIALIIANEMDKKCKITSAPAIEKPGDLAAVLLGLQDGDVLFIDEIHRLNKQVEEILYSAMEDYVIDIIIGQGPQAKSTRLHLPKFTLIGATTRAGLISAPLRDRFGISYKMEFYEDDELAVIISNSADKLNIKIDSSASIELAKNSRGTPRLANRLLKRIRDFAEIQNDSIITKPFVINKLKELGINNGLDNTDMDILSKIAFDFSCGPVGLKTLAASLNEDSGTLEDVHEPYLIKSGYISISPRGRALTDKAKTLFN